jgi:hypothetical protein
VNPCIIEWKAHTKFQPAEEQKQSNNQSCEGDDQRQQLEI